MDDLDRVRLIWDSIDDALPPEEQRRIVLIAAFTPEEQSAASGAETPITSIMTTAPPTA